MSDKKRLRLFISGKVQGVYFRQNTLEIANRNNVNGWVRNLSDGRVEVCVEGESSNVNTLVEWCKMGPTNSKVEDVHIIEALDCDCNRLILNSN
jgi:acylphosphatase